MEKRDGAQRIPCRVVHIQGWKNVRESYSRALEQGILQRERRAK